MLRDGEPVPYNIFWGSGEAYLFYSLLSFICYLFSIIQFRAREISDLPYWIWDSGSGLGW